MTTSTDNVTNITITFTKPPKQTLSSMCENIHYALELARNATAVYSLLLATQDVDGGHLSLRAQELDTSLSKAESMLSRIAIHTRLLEKRTGEQK